MGRRKSTDQPLFNPVEAKQLISDILKNCSKPRDGLTHTYLFNSISKHYSCNKEEFELFMTHLVQDGTLRQLPTSRYALANAAQSATGRGMLKMITCNQ